MAEIDFCQEEEWALMPAQHQRTILHLDVDCFYAQVEMVRDPSLRDKPLGIKQKTLMVTSNYVARNMGVKKSMWIRDALKILPQLVLVDGSDLTHYRQFSAEIYSVAQSFTPNVERLGLDENFVDISDLVEDYMCPEYERLEGHVYGDKDGEVTVQCDPCGCGCVQRLTAGTHVAKRLRQQILETTGITVCAGVANNKLIAKLVSGYHKPNNQTVVFPWQVHAVMNSLQGARSIPGIGSTTFKILEDLGISSIQELQNASLNLLKSRFDEETSKRIRDLSFGIDEGPVKKSGRPQSIGIEDAFRKVNSIAEVRVKYHTLLERLLKLLAKDGRVPGALKVSVRKYDKEMKFGHRETKQVTLLPSMFSTGLENISERSKSELMNHTMTLFHKMVDTKKAYHLTLVGVGFTKFIERAVAEKSISHFFTKRVRDDHEQGVTKSETKPSKMAKLSDDESFCANSNPSEKNEIGDRLVADDCPSECSSDAEDFQNLLWSTNQDGSSNELNFQLEDTTHKGNVHKKQEVNISNDEAPQLPEDVDRDVFNSLPPELQKEVLQSYQEKANSKEEITLKNELKNKKTENHKRRSKNSNFTLDSYLKRSEIEGKEPSVSSACVRNNESPEKYLTKESVLERPSCSSMSDIADSIGRTSNMETVQVGRPKCKEKIIENRTECQSSETLKLNEIENRTECQTNEILKRKGIDPQVFHCLPQELQSEILGSNQSLKPSISPRKSVKPIKGKDGSNGSSIMKYFKKK